MLNDIYFEEELPNFRLGARPRTPRRAQGEKPTDHDEPHVSEMPPISKGLMQQIISEVHTLSLQQQQLMSCFDTFQQFILD